MELPGVFLQKIIFNQLILELFGVVFLHTALVQIH